MGIIESLSFSKIRGVVLSWIIPSVWVVVDFIRLFMIGTRCLLYDYDSYFVWEMYSGIYFEMKEKSPGFALDPL